LTVSAKDQVVLPQAIRNELGITSGSEVEVRREGSGVMIRLKNVRPVRNLADGFGMLKYSGMKKLEDFDIAVETNVLVRLYVDPVNTNESGVQH
jgi:AbrB family looped-hinge helix DNA binding protein